MATRGRRRAAARSSRHEAREAGRRARQAGADSATRPRRAIETQRERRSGSSALNEQHAHLAGGRSSCTRRCSARCRGGATRCRQRRHRLGARRGAGVRVAAHGRRERAAHRAGRGARHVLAPPGGAARRRDRRDVHAAARICRRPRARSRSITARCREIGGAGVRVRLQHRGAGRRSCCGKRSTATSRTSAQPIIDQFLVGRPREVAAGFGARAAVAARVRGAGARALERASRAVSAARGRGQHARRVSVDAGAVLPRAATPGAARAAPPARADAAEVAAAPAGGGVASSRISPADRSSAVIDDPAAARTRDAGAAARLLHRQDVLRSDAAGERRRRTSRSCASRRLAPWPHEAIATVVDQYPNVEEVVWAQEEPKNMGAWTYVSAAAARLDRHRDDAALRRPPGAGEPGRGVQGGARRGAGAHRERRPDVCAGRTAEDSCRAARSRAACARFDSQRSSIEACDLADLSPCCSRSRRAAPGRTRGAAALGEDDRRPRHDRCAC